MTTVIDLGTDGPRTHAFLIGVGRYPYCADSATLTGPEAAIGRLFADVTSPPRSAMRFAEWLIAEQTDDEIAPLGTIELLASANVPPAVETPAGTVNVETPTYAAVERAFRRWYARCDEHEDNVAIFFFSGHGCERDSKLALLEDLGESPLAFFANAIDIDVFAAGMARCRAQTQCFFVDACRCLPQELLDLGDVGPKPLITPHVHSPYRHAPKVFATAGGASAFGFPDGTTIFTEVLIQALSGSAAQQRDNAGPWEITTDRIVPTINRLLEWAGATEQRATNGSDCGSRPIRRLRRSPVVPFRFGCQPNEALAKAELSLAAHGGDFHLRRSPEPTVWEASAAATTCALQAVFAGREFGDATRHLHLAPPCVALDLPVVPGRGVVR